MSSHCCVPGCHSLRNVPSIGIPPKDPLRSKWLLAIQSGPDNYSRLEGDLICLHHFKAEDFVFAKDLPFVKIVDSSAVPSIFPWTPNWKGYDDVPSSNCTPSPSSPDERNWEAPIPDGEAVSLGNVQSLGLVTTGVQQLPMMIQGRHHCSECDYNTIHPTMLVDHVKTMHPNAEVAASSDSNMSSSLHLSPSSTPCATPKPLKRMNNKLFCSACDYWTRDGEKLVNHERSHQIPAAQYKCLFCSYSASKLINLTRHVERDHPNSNSSESSDGSLSDTSKKRKPGPLCSKGKKLNPVISTFPCEHCQYVADTAEDLTQHKRRALHPEDFTGDTTESVSLPESMQSDSETKPKKGKKLTKKRRKSNSNGELFDYMVYVCPEPDCRYWDRYPKSFQRHYLDHNKTPIYQCSGEGCTFRHRKKPPIEAHIIKKKALDSDHEDATCVPIEPNPAEKYEEYKKEHRLPKSFRNGYFPPINRQQKRTKSDDEFIDPDSEAGSDKEWVPDKKIKRRKRREKLMVAEVYCCDMCRFWALNNVNFHQHMLDHNNEPSGSWIRNPVPDHKYKHCLRTKQVPSGVYQGWFGISGGLKTSEESQTSERSKKSSSETTTEESLLDDKLAGTTSTSSDETDATELTKKSSKDSSESDTSEVGEQDDRPASVACSDRTEPLPASPEKDFEDSQDAIDLDPSISLAHSDSTEPFEPSITAEDSDLEILFENINPVQVNHPVKVKPEIDPKESPRNETDEPKRKKSRMDDRLLDRDQPKNGSDDNKEKGHKVGGSSTEQNDSLTSVGTVNTPSTSGNLSHNGKNDRTLKGPKPSETSVEHTKEPTGNYAQREQLALKDDNISGEPQRKKSRPDDRLERTSSKTLSARNEKDRSQSGANSKQLSSSSCGTSLKSPNRETPSKGNMEHQNSSSSKTRRNDPKEKGRRPSPNITHDKQKEVVSLSNDVPSTSGTHSKPQTQPVSNESSKTIDHAYARTGETRQSDSYRGSQKRTTSVSLSEQHEVTSMPSTSGVNSKTQLQPKGDSLSTWIGNLNSQSASCSSEAQQKDGLKENDRRTSATLDKQNKGTLSHSSSGLQSQQNKKAPSKTLDGPHRKKIQPDPTQKSVVENRSNQNHKDGRSNLTDGIRNKLTASSSTSRIPADDESSKNNENRQPSENQSSKSKDGRKKIGSPSNRNSSKGENQTVQSENGQRPKVTENQKSPSIGGHISEQARTQQSKENASTIAQIEDILSNSTKEVVPKETSVESSNKEGEVSSLLPQALENLLNLDLSTGEDLNTQEKNCKERIEKLTQQIQEGYKLMTILKKEEKQSLQRNKTLHPFMQKLEVAEKRFRTAQANEEKQKTAKQTEELLFKDTFKRKLQAELEIRQTQKKFLESRTTVGITPDGSYTKEEQVVIDELKQKMEALAKEVLEVSDRKKKSTEDWLEADKELKESTQMVEKTRKEVADLEATLLPKTSQQHPSMSEMMDTMRKRINDCIEAERELARINHIKVVFGIRKTGQDWIKALEGYGVKIAPKKIKATVVESILENPILHQSNNTN